MQDGILKKNALNIRKFIAVEVHSQVHYAQGGYVTEASFIYVFRANHQPPHPLAMHIFMFIKSPRGVMCCM